jgi:hypothetical protein
MKRKKPENIGRAGHWLIFAGVPFAIADALFVITGSHHSLERAVGSNALPYVLFFGPAIIVVGSKIFYDQFTKGFPIQIGICGWIIGFSLMYWFFWFGPGAFKVFK